MTFLLRSTITTLFKTSSFQTCNLRAMSTQHNHLKDDCIFCKIIKKEIPSMKILETDKCFAFMDIEPLSEGHSLIIPKYHAQFMHEVPEDFLSEILPLAKKIASAGGYPQYNVLQNNGKLANQAVPHVHFHIIPKPDKESGLGIQWKPMNTTKEAIKAHYDELMKKL
ncbi:HIT-like domain-containing protein [Mycotypha africana]|uniref:HIT-like domain-containing protein n=1 Tax=Mycotypha africana TaxID=64632 RepID=UPI002300FFBC|nr:HIT-like domain-containing protein [Mycotypha africana]KAI8982185.1 HIT-like domain-containing protein [Mycotypha africana]